MQTCGGHPAPAHFRVPGRCMGGLDAGPGRGGWGGQEGCLRRMRGWGARARSAPARSRTSPPSGPGPEAVSSPSTPTPVPHPGLRVSLSPADLHRRVAKPRLRRERGNRAGERLQGGKGPGGPAGFCAWVCVCGGVHLAPRHLEVTSWPPPRATLSRGDQGAGGARTGWVPMKPVGWERAPPSPPAGAGCAGQEASPGGARGRGQVRPVMSSQSIHLRGSSLPPHLLDFAPGWPLLWGDFQGARVLSSFPSLPGANCPGIDREQTGCALGPSAPASEPKAAAPGPR